MARRRSAGHLVGHERVVEHVELASEQGIGGGIAGEVVARGAHRGEGVGVGEEGAPGELGRGAADVGCRRRLGVRLPPRLGQLDLERSELGFDAGDEVSGRRGHGGILRRRGVGSGGDDAAWPAGGAASTIEGAGALRRVGGGEDGAGVAGERLVDHLALERDRGLAAGDGIVVGREQAPGPVELLGRRGERAVGQRDLGGVDAELAPVADGASEGGVGEEVRPRRRAG